jgi:hypothetical protein
MSVEMIEAAWTDPVMRSEIIDRGIQGIPDHPVGTIAGLAQERSDLEAAETGLCGYSWEPDCFYYINSEANCVVTYVSSGAHCCY